ncbi:MAG: nucleoside deaminase [Pseudonocardiales bacterium]
MTAAAAGADEALVRRALEVAGGAAATGDIPIGAILVDADGVELAAACNAREATGDPTAHAELLVLRAGAARLRSDGRDSGWRLAGCTLAVTVEPCTMCAGALVAARVGRLVFGAWEPKTGAVGSLWDVVRDRRSPHRPEVVGGVLEQECADLLTGFMRLRRL